MKKKQLYGIAAVVLVALLVAAGCANPLTGEREPGPSDEGRVVLRFSDLRAMNIVPEISLDIDNYEVSFTRQGYQSVTLTDIGGDVTETEPVRLLPGPWQASVSAFNDEGTLIGFAEAALSVAARRTSTVTMAIQSLVGDGTLSLTADLDELELLDPAIVGTLISGASSEVIDISMSITGSSASFEANLAAGTYLLTLELAEAGASIASYVNTVLIVYDQITSATLVFRPASGSLAVELIDEITRPIAITLEELQPELDRTQSMTVIAATALQVNTYQWYLNGVKLPGEVYQAITLGPGLLEGEYLLTVVVQKGAVYSAQAGAFTIVSSPVTYTVSYDANGATSGTAPVDQTKIYGVDLSLATNSGNLQRSGDSYVGWNTAPDGSGIDYAESSTYTDDTDVTLYAKWSPLYQVGATGPAGGNVFYDKGEYTEGWRYLEAAPASTEWELKPWGGRGTRVGGTAMGIGTGAANTHAIVAAFGDEEPWVGRTDYAAKLIADLEYGGKSDWFLPSRVELDLIYENLYLHGLGGFAADRYWSSTEFDPSTGATSAWMRHFDDGYQNGYSKDNAFRVRGARAF